GPQDLPLGLRGAIPPGEIEAGVDLAAGGPDADLGVFKGDGARLGVVPNEFAAALHEEWVPTAGLECGVHGLRCPFHTEVRRWPDERLRAGFLVERSDGTVFEERLGVAGGVR